MLVGTHMMGTAHRHDYNGAVEVVNKTLEVMLRHVLSEHEVEDFDTWLLIAACAYNTSAHKALGGLPPLYAKLGHTPRHQTEGAIAGQPRGDNKRYFNGGETATDTRAASRR